jgi:hypothetical protein
MTILPSAEQLEKLPLRAIVAYATRAARRVSVILRGQAEYVIVNETLNLTESIVSSDASREISAASLMAAAARLAAMSATLREPQKVLAAMSVRAAARAAYSAIQAISDTSRSDYYARHAARAAATAARAIDALDEVAARAARERTRLDFEVLLQRFGEQHSVTFGQSFDISANASPLGPL